MSSEEKKSGTPQASLEDLKREHEKLLEERERLKQELESRPTKTQIINEQRSALQEIVATANLALTRINSWLDALSSIDPENEVDFDNKRMKAEDVQRICLEEKGKTLVSLRNAQADLTRIAQEKTEH